MASSRFFTLSIRFSLLGLLLWASFGCSTSSTPAAAEDTIRLPFREGALWGYLDAEGGVALPPAFREAGRFVHGLAPVREGDAFGYINPSGEYVMEPRWQLAGEFEEGYAVVWRNHQRYQLDTLGHTMPLADSVARIGKYPGHSVYKVTLNNGQQGLYHAEGHWLVQPYFRITDLDHDTWEVECPIFRRSSKPYHPLIEANKNKTGVMNSEGQWVIPMTPYHQIHQRGEGYLARWGESYRYSSVRRTRHYGRIGRNVNDSLIHIVNATGEVQETFSVYGKAKETLVFVEEDFWGFSYQASGAHAPYVAIMNAKGEQVFGDTTGKWINLTPVSEGRFFAQDASKHWYLFDTAGRQVSEEPLARLISGSEAPRYQNGLTLVTPVATDSIWLVWDREGNTLDTVPFSYEVAMERNGDYLTHDRYLHHPADEVCIYHLPTGSLQCTDTRGLWSVPEVPGLYYTQTLTGWGYVSASQGLIYQEPHPSTPLPSLDLTTLRQSLVFFALNEGYGYIMEESFYKSMDGSHVESKIPDSASYPQDSVFLVVDSLTEAVYRDRYQGRYVLWVNTSTAPIALGDASNVLLYTQAQDSLGQWHRLSYLEYGFLFWHEGQALAPGQQWQFLMPQYTGSYPTQLRYELVTFDQEYPTGQVWYSAPFPGRVNAAVFLAQKPAIFSADRNLYEKPLPHEAISESQASDSTRGGEE